MSPIGLLLLSGILVLFCGNAVEAADSVGAAYEGWSVQKLQIVGWPEALGEPPIKGLALGQKTGLLRPKRPRFRTDPLQQDQERLLLALARAGYPFAKIETRFEPDSEKRRVALRMIVTAGAEVRVSELKLSGLPEELAALESRINDHVTVGDLFDDRRIERARKSLTRALLLRGRAQASVKLTVLRVDSTRVVLEFLADAGREYRFAETHVSGVPEDLARLALKSTGIREGKIYSPQAVEQARENLRLLQLFRQIRLRTEPSGGASGSTDSLALYADLVTARLRSFRLSAGSWSDEPWRLRGFWRHRNLLHAGRGLEFDGSVSRHQRALGATVVWPALLTTRSRSEFSADIEQQVEESFDLLERNLGMAHLFPLGHRTSLRLGVTLSAVQLDDRSDDPEAFLTDDGLQLIFRSRWHQDRSDDLLDPTSGHRLDLDSAWSPPGFLSDAPYWSLRFSGSMYRPLGAGVVLAARADAGAAGPLGDAEDLLPNRRFFAGGVNTMRGYKRRRLGPLDVAGDPLGGDRRFLAGLELRVPLLGPLGGALFADSGRLYSRGQEGLGDEWAHAAGLGLLMRTPIGPIRLDIAHNLEEPPAEQPRQVFHLSIGHPY